MILTEKEEENELPWGRDGEGKMSSLCELSGG